MCEVQTRKGNWTCFRIGSYSIYRGRLYTYKTKWSEFEGSFSHRQDPHVTHRLKASAAAFAALRADGQVLCWGPQSMGGDASAVQHQLKA